MRYLIRSFLQLLGFKDYYIIDYTVYNNKGICHAGKLFIALNKGEPIIESDIPIFNKYLIKKESHVIIFNSCRKINRYKHDKLLKIGYY